MTRSDQSGRLDKNTGYKVHGPGGWGWFRLDKFIFSDLGTASSKWALLCLVTGDWLDHCGGWVSIFLS